MAAKALLALVAALMVTSAFADFDPSSLTAEALSQVPKCADIDQSGGSILCSLKGPQGENSGAGGDGDFCISDIFVYAYWLENPWIENVQVLAWGRYELGNCKTRSDRVTVGLFELPSFGGNRRLLGKSKKSWLKPLAILQSESEVKWAKRGVFFGAGLQYTTVANIGLPRCKNFLVAAFDNSGNRDCFIIGPDDSYNLSDLLSMVPVAF